MLMKVQEENKYSNYILNTIDFSNDSEKFTFFVTQICDGTLSDLMNKKKIV